MPPVVLTMLTFGAGVTTVVGIYSIISDLFLRDRRKVADRVTEEFRGKQRQRVQKSLLYKDLGLLSTDSGNGSTEFGIRQWFEDLTDQSGLDLRARDLVGFMCIGAAIGGVGGLLRQSIPFGIVLVVKGALMPLMYVRRKRKARIEKMLSQLPDAFDLMGRIVRSGQTMAQGLQAVADEFPPPIAAEFGFCYEQQNLGLPPEVSMRDLARRTGLLEIQIFVMALLIQYQTGGNLAELLDKLADMIRTRAKIRGQIQALTAEGRMQAAVLVGLPPALFGLLLLINYDYASTLFEFPILIVVTLAFELVGWLWIRKIVNFDI